MLCDGQKQHLTKLLKNYNFQYLRPPPDVYSLHQPQNQIFCPLHQVNYEKKRNIFYKVQYDAEEERAIMEAKEELKKKNIEHKLSDEIILKHIYAGGWNIDTIIERIRQIVEYHNNQKVTKFDNSTLKKLERGEIYTYGHDKQFRPLVIMRMDRFSLDRDMDEHFNAIFNLMLVVLGYRMVPYHCEKNVLIIDLNHMNFTRIPFKLIWGAIQRLQIYYCANMAKIFVFNAEGIMPLWKMISFFLSETQKKRINFIQKGQQHKILAHIDSYELERRYGGSLEDLTEYWPPKETHTSFELKMNQSLCESEYHSIENDDNFFRLEDDPMCGGANCGCDIY